MATMAWALSGETMESPWSIAALVIFAFALGARVCWIFTNETRALRKERERKTDVIMARVQDLLANKKVKRVTIKRREKKR